VRLSKVELDRNELLELSDDELTFFLAFGDHANEINAVTKLMYWAGGEDAAASPQAHGRQTMLVFLLRILGGKLFEGWQLLQKTLLKREMGRDVIPQLDERIGTHLEALKKYFGRENAAEVIRNKFGFHYSAEKLVQALADSDDPLLMYMDGEAAPNTLFYFSEVAIVDAMIGALREKGLERTLSDLVSEFFELAVSFSQVADGVMDVLIKHHVGDMRSAPPELIDIEPFPKFEEISIPWFVDLTTVLERISAQPNKSPDRVKSRDGSVEFRD